MSNGSIFLTVFLWALFGFQHSLLAQEGVKNLARKWLGTSFVDYFYRFIYFLTQSFIYPSFWFLVSHLENRSTLWVWPQSLYPLNFLLRLSGHFLIIATFMVADLSSFIGLKQVAAFILARFRNRPLPELKVFGDNKLVLSFPFTLVRHPLYLGIILSLLGATGHYTVKFLLNLICLIAYIEIGTVFEEKQLVRQFGESYREYQAKVPKYLPFIRPRGMKRLSGLRANEMG